MGDHPIPNEPTNNNDNPIKSAESREKEQDRKRRAPKKCIHNKLAAFCVPCGGSQICVHQKRKSRCVQCRGSQICEHLKVKSQCVDCGGSQICIHKKQKAKCVLCHGSQICIHDKQKDYCKLCRGAQICKHNMHRAYCKDCKGSQICVHGRGKSNCSTCDAAKDLLAIATCESYNTSSKRLSSNPSFSRNASATIQFPEPHLSKVIPLSFRSDSKSLPENNENAIGIIDYSPENDKKFQQDHMEYRRQTENEST